jgi:broad specificity phosphatase PhoE
MAHTRLTLVRHGETSANLDGVWHGSTDTALTPRGRTQARRVAAHLAATRSDARTLYASPLRRALDTASPIGTALGLEARVEPDLREYCLGVLEGVSYRELHERHRLFERMREDPDACFGGTDTARAVALRFAGALERIAARHPGERSIVVGHGGALTLALGWLLDGDPSAWRRVMGNCAVSELALDVATGRFELASFNETDHLEDC